VARRLLTVAGLAGLYLYVASFAGALTDDAFISATYARNLLAHGTWGLFPGRPANTATSPLRVGLLAALGLVAPTAADALVWLTTAELAATLWGLARLSRALFGTADLALFAGLALLANPMLVSAFGMETTLLLALVVLALEASVAERWARATVLAGLATLARPDGALLALILGLAAPLTVRKRLALVALYLGVLLPWHLFAWVELGGLVPDTLVIKLRQRAFGDGATFATGLLRLGRRLPFETIASFAWLPLAAVALKMGPPAARRVAAIVAGLGLVHFAGYAYLHVPPYLWYYALPAALTCLLGGLGIAALRARVSAPALRRGLRAAALLPAVPMLVLVVRDGLPLPEMPFFGNWATHARYREVGIWIRDHVPPTAVIELRGEIGTLAYYSERFLVNEFSDRNRTARTVPDPAITRLLAVNFRWRTRLPPVPAAGYQLLHDPRDGTPRALEGLVESWPTSTRRWPSGRIFLVRKPERPSSPGGGG
jgi:hypothetical protein